MDNDKKLFENLLKADGIEPSNITDDERMVFKAMLDSEQKRHKRLSLQYIAGVWIVAMAFLGLRFSEKILDALHIPFVVAFGLIITAAFIMMILVGRKLSKGDRKVRRLQYLTNDTRRGVLLVGKKNGRRFIYWPRVIAFAVKSWLVVSLTFAGLHYLYYRQWIYSSSSSRYYIFLGTMMSLSPVAAMLRRGLKTPIEELVEVKTKPKTLSYAKPDVWRIIMNSKITKYAVAAMILIAVGLSITVFDKTMPVAYATQILTEAIEASHSVQYLHIKSFMASVPDVPIECWVEFDTSGQIKNVRINKPAWMDPSDGDSVIVWKDGKMKLWIKKKNFLVVMKDQEVAAQILGMVEQFDPKNAVANVLKAQEEGDTKIEIEEPESKAEPIMITATSLVENDLPFQRVVLFVDQATNLLNSAEAYQLKDGEYILFSTIDFYDYNIPIDSKMFTFDNIPDDVMRMDQTTQEVGLAQGDLTDKEIAVEVIRQFLQALIEEDYSEAGRMFSGVPAKRMKRAYGQIRFIRIISIGEPQPNTRMSCLYVPCTVEIEENGKISQWHPEHSYVRQVHGQPERWEIIGGFRGI